jgi:glycosyltransferase involved in cell wall biosynthesis
VGALLADSDVLLQPSFTEGSPNAVLEAMAHGLAVLASPVGGILDIQAAAGTLTLLPPTDADAWGQALQRLANDRQHLERLGAANLQAVRAGMSIERTAQTWLELYRSAD